MRWFAGIAAFLLISSVVASSADAQPPRGRPFRGSDNLKVGDAAPDFTLKSLDGKKKVALSDYRGKKPVALIFGSYT